MCARVYLPDVVGVDVGPEGEEDGVADAEGRRRRRGTVGRRRRRDDRPLQERNLKTNGSEFVYRLVQKKGPVLLSTSQA